MFFQIRPAHHFMVLAKRHDPSEEREALTGGVDHGN